MKWLQIFWVTWNTFTSSKLPLCAVLRLEHWKKEARQVIWPKEAGAALSNPCKAQGWRSICPHGSNFVPFKARARTTKNMAHEFIISHFQIPKRTKSNLMRKPTGKGKWCKRLILGVLSLTGSLFWKEKQEVRAHYRTVYWSQEGIITEKKTVILQQLDSEMWLVKKPKTNTQHHICTHYIHPHWRFEPHGHYREITSIKQHGTDKYNENAPLATCQTVWHEN